MKKIYYLSTCSTCSRIIKELGLTPDKIAMQDIKTEPITAPQLEEMKAMSGDYESLFSRRSMKYKAWGLGEKNLGEADYKKYILEEYTFLKRPVIIWNDQIFVGNAKAVVEAAKVVIG
ncbi:arsenate reductase [Reichenbachiella agarivorans]|uniref:Arsenate reductase n=1 Tax=Reichenbachiella agarivorans TaxID=2979464 RepID=A0ABY6CQ71_9BACT|nr:ArsC/Spx/MgsR family protein [Reichenbachiella agarivorans]UXP31583.1 arsenate reductase [Reichenbachiella agarivorans]